MAGPIHATTPWTRLSSVLIGSTSRSSSRVPFKSLLLLSPPRPLVSTNSTTKLAPFSSLSKSYQLSSSNQTHPYPPLPPTDSNTPQLQLKTIRRKDYRPWTLQDDQTLLDMRAKGCNWTAISKVIKKSRQACTRRGEAILEPAVTTKPIATSLAGIAGHSPVKGGHRFWEEKIRYHRRVTVNRDDETKEDGAFDAREGQGQEQILERNTLLMQLVDQGQSWREISKVLGAKAYACEKQWRNLRKEEILNAKKEEQEVSKVVKRKIIQFRKQDDEILMKALSALPHYNEDEDEDDVDLWERISREEFGGLVSPVFLRRRAAELEKRRQVWKRVQETSLIETVKALSLSRGGGGAEMTGHDWDQVADQIPGEHTAAECRIRWEKLQMIESRRQPKKESNPIRNQGDLQ